MKETAKIFLMWLAFSAFLVWAAAVHAQTYNVDAIAGSAIKGAGVATSAEVWKKENGQWVIDDDDLNAQIKSGTNGTFESVTASPDAHAKDQATNGQKAESETGPIFTGEVEEKQTPQQYVVESRCAWHHACSADAVDWMATALTAGYSRSRLDIEMNNLMGPEFFSGVMSLGTSTLGGDVPISEWRMYTAIFDISGAQPVLIGYITGEFDYSIGQEGAWLVAWKIPIIDANGEQDFDTGAWLYPIAFSKPFLFQVLGGPGQKFRLETAIGLDDWNDTEWASDELRMHDTEVIHYPGGDNSVDELFFQEAHIEVDRFQEG